jgi:TusA-related sulfurtransferase
MAALSCWRVLDVSGLEPPEPLVRILAALENLPPGTFLHVHHRREPFPLYAILEQSGYSWHTRRYAENDYEIDIWRREDGGEANESIEALPGHDVDAA